MFASTQFFGFNWVDLLFVLVMVYFVMTSRGLIETILDILGFIFSLIAAYRFYGFFGHLVFVYFQIPQGIANAIGFFIAWFLFESVLFTLITFFILKLIGKARSSAFNVYGGYFAGVIHGAVVFLFLISLIFSFPTRGQIKQAILDSRTGPAFVSLSQALQLRMKNVFGDAIADSINFLTVKPESDSSLDLGFKLDASKLSPDPESEKIMLDLVNKERVKAGQRPLTFDPELLSVARAYGKQMMENGFFSHTSQVDGSSPGDRATKAGVDYDVLGENLAYAPDVYIAHQGLMNSPGHRANILSPDYTRVGIGVIDGGIYGKIFVQEFRN